MKQNTFSVHFVVRSDRVNDDGYAPIYAKVTLNGKPLLLTANNKIKVQDWNTKKGIPLPRAANCTGINEALQALETRIRSAYSRLVATSEYITIDALKAEIIGKEKPKEKEHLLIETTIEHNQNFSKLVGIKYSEGSYKTYQAEHNTDLCKGVGWQDFRGYGTSKRTDEKQKREDIVLPFILYIVFNTTELFIETQCLYNRR
jgi:hypothetical protein